MGLIHIDLFTTLDGVAQAPGGPDEDTEGGFAFGGWQAPLFDDVIGEQVGAGIAELDALLLGRKTYDIFAAYWPHQDERDRRGLQPRPQVRRLTGHPTLDWAGSTLLGPDLAGGAPGCATATRTCTSSAASTSCRRCSPSGSSTCSRCGSSRSCSGSGKKVFAERRRAGEPRPRRARRHLAEGRGAAALRPCRTGPPAPENMADVASECAGRYLRNLLVVLSASTFPPV